MGGMLAHLQANYYYRNIIDECNAFLVSGTWIKSTVVVKKMSSNELIVAQGMQASHEGL